MKKIPIINNQLFLNTNMLQMILSRRLMFYSFLKWLLCSILTLLLICNLIQTYILNESSLLILTNSLPNWVITFIKNDKLKPFIKYMRHLELALAIICCINVFFIYRVRQLKWQIKQIWKNSHKAEALVKKHYLHARFQNIGLNLVIFLYFLSAFMITIACIFFHKKIKINFDKYYEIDNWLFYIYFFIIIFILLFFYHCFCFVWNKKIVNILTIHYKDIIPNESLVATYISKRYTKFLIILLIIVLMIAIILFLLLFFFDLSNITIKSI